MSSNENVKTARSYLAALEAGVAGQALAAFFDPDVVQTEFPNRLLPAGAVRNLDALLAAAERGKLAVQNQRYEVRHVVAEGDFVALEVDWSATSKVPFGQTPAGAVLRAAFAVFLQFREGRVIAQRNYDCFRDL
ncbi:MAG: nuclear transport factor 2 family protein [Myxococcota bacterium]|nr:nuclear transport factor 2 family protein [Myxococcota bacterium]